MVDFDSQTSHHYGTFKTQLRRQGRPIPENDLWIAALANQHNLVLVTRDPHFSEIAELRREIW